MNNCDIASLNFNSCSLPCMFDCFMPNIHGREQKLKFWHQVKFARDVKTIKKKWCIMHFLRKNESKLYLYINSWKEAFLNNKDWNKILWSREFRHVRLFRWYFTKLLICILFYKKKLLWKVQNREIYNSYFVFEN